MLESFITRRVDDLGRIVIPSEIRKNFNITAGDKIEFFFDGNFICLRKKNTKEKEQCSNCPYQQKIVDNLLWRKD